MRWRLLVAGGGGLLAFPVVGLLVVVGVAAGSLATTTTILPAANVPTAYAQADIPTEYLAWYAHWTRECPGLSWGVVAAIGKLESDHGRAPLPGVISGHNGYGAAGPMQLGIGGQAGDTWAVYGVDGDVPPDGIADVYHAPDAIRGAVGYLCAHGSDRGPEGVRGAVFAYNSSEAYVEAVFELAERYAAPTNISADAAGLLTNPQVQLSDNARADLEAGVIDARVVTLLAALTERYPPIAVSVLKSGHAPYVQGTSRYSHHYFGRAADLSVIGGQPVNSSNPAAREAGAWLASLSDPLRPAEVGSPFDEFDPIPGWFSDQAHRGHIHVGYEP